MADVIIPRVGPEGDPAARLVWYMWADEGIKAFAPHMFALAVEASQHDEEARPTCARPTSGSSAS